MRFQVPQFIEVEDKIFGPLTFKQFAYIIGGAGVCFIFYHFLGLYIGLIFILPVGILAAALAFYKVNNKPFLFVMEAAIKYFFASKLYIWKKEQKAPVAKAAARPEESAGDFFVPKLSDSKLKELTWSLDIKQAENPVTRGDGTRNV